MSDTRNANHNRLRDRLRGFHRDEQGDEGVNKILIIALIAVPLVIILIIFGKEIVQWFKDAWADLAGEDPIDTTAPGGP
ncbi:MAG: hypothetical protein OER88_05745 [Planctomycetota bacterium]|nr:hypothetical protein [Planctomycetota bacterium]